MCHRPSQKWFFYSLLVLGSPAPILLCKQSSNLYKLRGCFFLFFYFRLNTFSIYATKLCRIVQKYMTCTFARCMYWSHSLFFLEQKEKKHNPVLFVYLAFDSFNNWSNKRFRYINDRVCISFDTTGYKHLHLSLDIWILICFVYSQTAHRGTWCPSAVIKVSLGHQSSKQHWLCSEETMWILVNFPETEICSAVIHEYSNVSDIEQLLRWF